MNGLVKWYKEVGKKDKFVGSLLDVFPLHDREELDDLSAKWATYSLITSCTVKAKQSESSSRLSYFHPENGEVTRFALFYQPLNEIRDYFGDEVAMYFAWLEVYTRALVVPSVLGVVTLCWQIHKGNVDQNPLTIPYSSFLARQPALYLSSHLPHVPEHYNTASSC